MAFVAGIDEAGVGPRLGPLVAASVTFRGDDGVLAGSLWELLAPALAPAGQRIVVADSKLIYRGQRDRAGFRRLEHAVLAFVAAASGLPSSLAKLLQAVSAPTADGPQRCPWYKLDAVALPRAATRDDIWRAAERLAGCLRGLGIEPPRLACEVMDERAFNRLITASGGKGGALLEIDKRLLRRLPGTRGEVYLDRLGGRHRYGRWLEEVFPQAFVWTRGEDASISRYAVARTDGGSLEVIVAVGCEGRQLPVALASMLAKYVRELHMAALNRFWAARVPGLAPTAGYPADAARFVRQISAAAQAEGLAERDFVRCR